MEQPSQLGFATFQDEASGNKGQLLVGASRQRAAPRSQFWKHGAGAPCKAQRRRGVLGLQVY